MNIYVDCDKSEMNTFKVGDEKVKPEHIAEEDEGGLVFDEKIKLVLKMK